MEELYFDLTVRQLRRYQIPERSSRPKIRHQSMKIPALPKQAPSVGSNEEQWESQWCKHSSPLFHGWWVEARLYDHHWTIEAQSAIPITRHQFHRLPRCVAAKTCLFLAWPVSVVIVYELSLSTIGERWARFAPVIFPMLLRESIETSWIRNACLRRIECLLKGFRLLPGLWERRNRLIIPKQCGREALRQIDQNKLLHKGNTLNYPTGGQFSIFLYGVHRLAYVQYASPSPY